MDWVNEKIEKIQRKIKNLPLKKTLLVYLVVAIFAAALCSWVTGVLCHRWSMILYNKSGIVPEIFTLGSGMEFLIYPNMKAAGGTETVQRYLVLLHFAEKTAPFLYVTVFSFFAAARFYRFRLREPAGILRKAAEEIQNNNLEFDIEYDNTDEMGQLCDSFERMRLELIKDKEAMWRLIDEQKKVNAAFAHDLRTPLTVLKGYTDFLYRYLPEGRVSEEKLTDTLKLMSEHLTRLDSYSRTMKIIRSFEEIQIHRTETNARNLQTGLNETARALSRIGDVEVCFTPTDALPSAIWIDEAAVMEVFDNLLANAIRYGKSRVDISIEADEASEMLHLYVRDDGPGFTEEALEKAGRPYYHGTDPTSHARRTEENDPHFGIGLHIASLLCKKHGGTLSLANSVEGGALASVSFSYRNS